MWPDLMACILKNRDLLAARSNMLRETARMQQQVRQHLDGTRATGSLFAQPVDLISFKSYGAD